MSNGAMDIAAYRAVLRIAAIIAILYGLSFLLAPEMQFQMSQDPSGIGAGWVRWAGGALIGFGVLQWLASADPAKQRPVVIGAIVTDALIALALLYSALSGEYQGVAWYIWVPILISAAFVAAFCWLAGKYKAVL